MSDFLTQLERDLIRAAARRAEADAGRRVPVWRTSPRPLLVAAALPVVMTASAAAATLTVLRGSPLPGPSEEVAGIHATPVPGSSKVEPMRARDPGGGPPWALRVARSKTELVCTTVGQVVEGEFGIVGLDRRFRPLSETAVDGCGQLRRNATSLVGARVFDAPRRSDVRTVVDGFAGAELRSVSITAGSSARSVPVGPDGTFVAVLRGYPEDIGIRAVLRFADGHEETHVFGAIPSGSLDPSGLGAWEASDESFAGYPPLCVTVHPVRSRPDAPSSPPACGVWPKGDVQPTGYFFAVRRLVATPGAPSFARGHWTGPPRTAVWGAAGEDVTRIIVRGPRVRRAVKLSRDWAPEAMFVAVFPPSVDPRRLRVEVTLKDGTVNVERGDANLVPPRKEP